MNSHNNPNGSGTSTLGKRGNGAILTAADGTTSAAATAEPSNSVELSSSRNASLGSKRRKFSYPSSGTAPAKPAIKKLVYSPEVDLLEGCEPHSIIKVFIAIKYIVGFDSKANVSVWGTNTYTDDSDLIAACIHDGSLKLEEIEKRNPSPAGICVTLKIDGSQRRYPGNVRNGIKSQTWANYQGNSFSIIKVRFIDPELSRNNNGKNNNNTATTYNNNNSSSNANSVRKRRNEERFKKLFLPNVTVVFNLSNEPCLKYSLNTVADKGFEDNTLTSYRLLTEVMFVETHNCRFELSLHEKTDPSIGTVAQDQSNTNASNNNNVPSLTSANGNGSSYRYRWARVLFPHTLDMGRLSSLELPLADDQVELIYDELKWSEFQWSSQSVTVRNVEYQICRIQFCKRSREIILQSPTTNNAAQNIPVDAGSSDNRAPTPQEDNSTAAPNSAMDSTSEDGDSNAYIPITVPSRRAKKGRGGRISTEVATVTRSAAAAAAAAAATPTAASSSSVSTIPAAHVGTSSSDEMD